MDVDRRGHIVELQSIRGIASLLVVIGHAWNFYVTPAWFHHFGLIFNGRAAVSMFFVLSGFVISRSLETSSLRRSELVAYVWKRVARIHPAIWVVSAASLLFALTLFEPSAFNGSTEYIQTRFNYERLRPLYVAAAFLGLTSVLVPPLWSVSVEIVGSTLLPLFVSIRRRGWVAGVIMVAALVAISFSRAATVFYHAGLYLPHFAIGCCLASRSSPSGVFFRRARPAAGLLATACSAGLLLSQYAPIDYYSPVMALAEALLSASLIGVIAYGGWSTPLLRSRPILWLGDISYSVYLWHFLMMCFAALLIGGLVGGMDIVSRTLLLGAVTVALSILVAWPSYRFIERGGVSLGKRFAGGRPSPR